MVSFGRLFVMLVVGTALGAIGALYAVANPVSIAGLSLPRVPSLQAAPPAAPALAPQAVPGAATLKQDSSSVIDVYQRVSAAVVNINFSSPVRDAFGRTQTQEGSGSGFIIEIGRAHV